MQLAPPNGAIYIGTLVYLYRKKKSLLRPGLYQQQWAEKRHGPRDSPSPTFAYNWGWEDCKHGFLHTFVKVYMWACFKICSNSFLYSVLLFLCLCVCVSTIGMLHVCEFWVACVHITVLYNWVIKLFLDWTAHVHVWGGELTFSPSFTQRMHALIHTTVLQMKNHMHKKILGWTLCLGFNKFGEAFWQFPPATVWDKPHA